MGLAMMIRSYFDESAEGEVGKGFLTVAGYVLNDAGLRGLERDWGKLLAKYQLPYFHMSECNADDRKSGENVFAHLDDTDCIKAATEAIAIARKYPLHGVAYVVRQEDYRSIMEDEGFDCDPYTFLLWTALIHTSKWRDRHHMKSGLLLFFEDGWSTQSKANALLQAVTHDPRYKQDLRITSHSFFKKADSYPGQAADLIAWHVRKGNENQSKGKPIRKDTMALITDRSTKTIHYDKVQLTILRDSFIRHSGSLQRASKILFNPDGPIYHGD